MNQRMATLSSLALVGTLALAGCGAQKQDGGSTGGGSDSGSTANTSQGGECPQGTSLSAQGSSAQKNAIEEAIASYQEKCEGARIDYNATGSGAGIKALIAGQADWAGSDSALKTEAKNGKVEAEEAEKACGSPAWNIPMVTGPIAIAYNVEGVDKLILTPDVAAKIFSGKITTWNDPALAAVNPGVTLPAQPIKVFFRSDESGTTENFTKYLKAAAGPAWTAEPGKSWTGKGEGKTKSDGVAQAVKGTPGGITYVEWSYAKDNELGMAQIDNGGGPVELTGESVGKAVEAAKQDGEGNDLRLKLDYATKEAGAYPILLVTYEIVCSKSKDAAKGAQIKSFLKHFASAETQQGLQEVGYAPLPESVRAKVDTAIDALQ